jgi:hypothetical protein
MNQTSNRDTRLIAQILIGLGVVFLLGQVLNISWAGLLWPFFVIAPGLPFLYFAHSERKNAGLIFPGIIITGTGLLLLYQNLTGHWESWAYAWALYPVMVGLGLQFNGERNGSDGEVKTGRGMVRYGLMGFAGLALLFELLIFGGLFGGLTGLLWPLALVAGGAYLLMNYRKGGTGTVAPSKRKVASPEKPKRNIEQDDGPSAEIDPELRRKIDAALAEDNAVPDNGRSDERV